MKIGYRTESAYGSNVRKLKDIIFFEVSELLNIDIFEYCINNYQLPKHIKYKLRNTILLIEEGQEVNEERLKRNIDNLIDSLNKIFEIDLRYGLWVCENKQTIIDYYDANEYDVDTYDVSDGIIISDLGEDGILYAFEFLPQPIKN